MAAPARSLKRLTLAEAVGFDGVTVDRDAGIIHNVKVLGRTSKRRRTYTEACQKDAVDRQLYEGAPVYIDHACDSHGREAPYAPRKAADRFGALRGQRVEGDAVRADLHYLKSHPMAATVCEAAERGLNRFGLSHNADAEGERHADGSITVHRLTEVRSVDVVDDPATADSFLEQRRRADAVSVTYREFFTAWAPKLPRPLAGKLRPLLEQGDDYMDGNMSDAPPMPEEDSSAADAGDAVSTALMQAVVHLVEKAMSGELDKAEAIKKIRKLFNTHTAVSDQGATEAPADDEAEESGGDSEEPATEQYRRLDAALTFCERHEYRPTKRQVEMLAAMKTDDHRMELLESFKATAGRGGPFRPARPQPGSAPRLAAPAARPSGVGTAPTGAKELGQWLRG